MGTSKSTPPGITGVGCASKIRRVGRVPLEIYSDPRLADATPLDLLLLVTAYVHARRDDSQRVKGEAAPMVGWLLTDEGEGLTVQDLSRLMKGPEETSRRPLRRLNTRGFLVMSDAFVWGVTGWERPDTRRIRNLRAARKAAPDIVSARLDSPACEVLTAAEELTLATRIVTQRADLWESLATFATSLRCALSSAAVAWATANDTDDEALLALTTCARSIGGEYGGAEVAVRAANLKRSKDAVAPVAPVDAEPDFYAFERGTPLNPLPRPTSAARAKVGPQGISNDDAATAERDNRRPMGRR